MAIGPPPECACWRGLRRRGLQNEDSGGGQLAKCDSVVADLHPGHPPQSATTRSCAWRCRIVTLRAWPNSFGGVASKSGQMLVSPPSCSSVPCISRKADIWLPAPFSSPFECTERFHRWHPNRGGGPGVISFPNLLKPEISHWNAATALTSSWIRIASSFTCGRSALRSVSNFAFRRAHSRRC